MRFAAPPNERADAIAALTLVRALANHLIEPAGWVLMTWS